MPREYSQKRLLVKICVLIFLLCGGMLLAFGAMSEEDAAWAQDTRFYTPPIVSVPKIVMPPRVDGMIEPKEWANAASLSPFVLVGGRSLPSYPTSVYVMYDDHKLYIGAIMSTPNPAALRADVTERDGPVWEDDSLELFFDTDDERKTYIHLAINPKGIQYDALRQDKSADYRWRAETAILSDGWSAELELPFANDLPPSLGVAWGFSIARHVAADGEISAWDRKLKGFHELEHFGSMIFADKPVTVQMAALGGLWLGPNTAQIIIENLGAQPFAGKLAARVMGRDKYGHYFGVTKIEVPAYSRQQLNMSYIVPQDGFSHVTFGLTDATGKTVWRSAPYPILTPEVAPNIAAVERTLAAATKLWTALPAGEAKTKLQGELEACTVQWRYLITQYRDRAKLSRAELEALAQFADKLRREAEMLENHIKAAKTTGALPSFALAGVLPLQHVFPEDHCFELGTAPTMHACRNETEALQVAILPFVRSR